ncbi:unnamed protein product, partial [marine sediment metagenome]
YRWMGPPRDVTEYSGSNDPDPTKNFKTAM